VRLSRVVGLALAALAPAVVGAQEGAVQPGVPPVVFRAIERARLAEARGAHEVARATLDTLVGQLPSGTEALAEALFWRATFAAEGDAAERDYRRLLVEVPAGARAEAALFRLVELELVRGQQGAARQYLQRLWRDHPAPATQGRTAYWLARSWFDAGDATRACGALAEARTRVPPAEVELVAAIGRWWPRCAGVASARAANGATVALGADGVGTERVPREAGTPPVGRDSATRASAAASPRDSATRPSTPPVSQPAPAPSPRDSATRPSTPPVTQPAPAPSPRDSATRPSTPPVSQPAPAPSPRDSATRPSTPPVSQPAPAPTPAAPPTAGTSAMPPAALTPPPRVVRYAVQLMATNVRAEAERSASRLVARGIEARVDGDVAPFRVRTGRFATWAEAARRLAQLKAQGLTGFVAEVPEAAP
jgi:hypothetical protein